MSGTTRLALMLLALVFAGFIVYQLVASVVTALLSLLVPILVVGAVAVVLYYLIGRRALGGGRRILP